MKNSYFISTPYIDAYQTSERYNGFTLIDFNEFAKNMLSQCYQWGEMGIGRAYCLGKEIPEKRCAPVLAFGTFGEKKYVMVYLKSDDDHLLIEVDDIPYEWNVT